ncbi:MAG: hypothetical protein A2V98_02800 [Planctomycetes bacterium RBG_16_64_12]|nr:MAG: hypothetical protein A2V98_02800 [Planctomycetes bacterium RBG_16_64_12]
MILLAAAPPAASPLPASERPSYEQLRGGVDADGQVTDPRLRQETGWAVVRGFAWRIELEDTRRPGWFVPVDARDTFHGDQRFRIEVEAFCDVYVYVVVRNADGSHDVLLPEPGEETPRMAKGQTVVLPSDGTAFRFQPPGGTHQLRLVASPVKLPWADSRRLLDLKNGQELPTQGESNPATPRSIPQVKGLEAVIRQIDRGDLAKGCVVELVEPAAEGNLVTLTSADPSAKPILVHDVALKQVD